MGGSFRLMDGGFPKVTRRIKGYFINDKLGGTFVEGVIGERAVQKKEAVWKCSQYYFSELRKSVLRCNLGLFLHKSTASQWKVPNKLQCSCK